MKTNSLLLVLILSYALAFGQMVPKSVRDFQNSRNTDTIALVLSKLHQSSDYLLTPQNRIQHQKALEGISVHQTHKYGNQIDRIYNDFSAKKDCDPEFYKVILKYRALLDYRRDRYSDAVNGFNEYFRLSKTFTIRDTLLAGDYAPLAVCFYKLDSTDQFFSLIDSGIALSTKKRNPFNDLSLMYYTSGTYFSSIRQVDTARILFDKAQKYWNQSHNKDYKLISELYKKLSYIELISENNELALDYLNQSLTNLLKSNHDEIEMASIIRDKGKILLTENQLAESIKQFKMAIHIIENEYGKQHKSISGIYRYLGLAYHNLGNYPEAVKYYTLSLENKSDDSETITLRNLADAYAEMNELKLADFYYKKSLDLLISKKGPDHYQTTMGYFKYGQFLIEKEKNYISGEEFIQKAIVHRYKHYKGVNIDLVAPLNILGAHYINHGELDRGIDTLQSALYCAIPKFNYRNRYENPPKDQLINNVAFNNSLAWKAYGFYLTYQHSGDLKDLRMSYDTYVLYLFCINETRKYYDYDESLKTSQEIHHVFNQAINVGYLLYSKTSDENLIAEIFKFIEGKKSFTLFQSLSILEKKKLLNVPKELLQKEQLLKQNLGLITEKIKVEKSLQSRDAVLKTLDIQSYAITESLDSIQAIYKTNYSGFYNLKYGFKEITIDEIIERTPKETVFINFSLSDTLLNTITFNNREYKLYSQTIDSNFYNNIRTLVGLLKKVDTDRSHEEFQLFTKVSYSVYSVLFGNIEKTIQNKELIIVPDAELNYLSFDALLTEQVIFDRPDYSKLPYLIKTNKSNVANSMQIYFHMKRNSHSTNKQVFAFAPIYQSPTQDDSLPPEYRNLRNLDYSEEEISHIAKYFDLKKFSNFQATKEIFSQEAKNGGVLHLAMHTQINDTDPLYSRFLFTYDSTHKSGPVNTFELLTYDLTAELVVLSGCSTGDGELQKGEGVMSLSSGFQFAGVPSIVMSLWEVNDRFGSLVIDRFYKNLAKGHPKNNALYQAKLDVLNEGNALYAHPYYWAGLTLMGNEEPLSFARHFSPTIYLSLAFIGLFLSFLIFKIRKNG